MSKHAAKIQLFADTSLSADFLNVIHLTMKKLFLLSMMCLMALSMQAQKHSVELDFQLGTNVTDRGDSVFSSSVEDSTGYTDLGLPSGTKWKNFNATGFYTYDEAVSKFGNRLPTKEQWEELLLVIYARRLRRRVVPRLPSRQSGRGRLLPLRRSVRPACSRLMIARSRTQSLDKKDHILLLNGPLGPFNLGSILPASRLVFRYHIE